MRSDRVDSAGLVLGCLALLARSSAEPCKCKELWSEVGADLQAHPKCFDQHGCEALACDGDTRPWCHVSNPGCEQEEKEDGGEWAYCIPLKLSDGKPFGYTDDVRAIPKPDGHTSQVSPHQGAHDREWYAETRWKMGPYPVQDGVITEKPEHAPVPETTTYVAHKARQPRNHLQNHGYQERPATAAPMKRANGGEHSGNATAPTHGAGKEAPTGFEGEVTSPRRMNKFRGRRNAPPAEEAKLSMDKPGGHTSQVSPHNGAHDVEWYAEGGFGKHWKNDSLPVQDGVIIAKPKHA